MIAIVNYGVGNITSLMNTFGEFDQIIELTNDATVIKEADLVILPGVGRFETAMNSIDNKNLRTVLNDRFNRKKPIIGICLGMQIMFESSEENIGVKGLGWFKGTGKRLPSTMTIPHMGWNNIENKNKDDMYFVHSYYIELLEDQLFHVNCTYGLPFPAYIQKESVLGMQFHPEKSGKAGSDFLKDALMNFRIGENNETICCD
jgi:glutamine amidotransferase